MQKQDLQNEAPEDMGFRGHMLSCFIVTFNILLAYPKDS